MRTLIVLLPLLCAIGYAIYVQFRNWADNIKLQLLGYFERLQSINTQAELYALHEEVKLYGALNCDTVLFGLREKYLQLLAAIHNFKPPTAEEAPTRKRMRFA